jgi:hypothetical protein
MAAIQGAKYDAGYNRWICPATAEVAQELLRALPRAWAGKGIRVLAGGVV